MSQSNNDELAPKEYISYNGLGRSPTIWGIAYMTGLAVVSTSLLGGLLLGVFVSQSGWFFALIGIPILIFIKIISTNDDRAVKLLFLETKWMVIKLIRGNAQYHGGTLTIAPLTYGRKLNDVKRYLEKTISR